MCRATDICAGAFEAFLCTSGAESLYHVASRIAEGWHNRLKGKALGAIWRSAKIAGTAHGPKQKEIDHGTQQQT